MCESRARHSCNYEYDTVFKDVTPYSLADTYQRFNRTCGASPSEDPDVWGNRFVRNISVQVSVYRYQPVRPTHTKTVEGFNPYVIHETRPH